MTNYEQQLVIQQFSKDMAAYVAEALEGLMRHQQPGTTVTFKLMEVTVTKGPKEAS